MKRMFVAVLFRLIDCAIVTAVLLTGGCAGSPLTETPPLSDEAGAVIEAGTEAAPTLLEAAPAPTPAPDAQPDASEAAASPPDAGAVHESGTPDAAPDAGAVHESGTPDAAPETGPVQCGGQACGSCTDPGAGDCDDSGLRCLTCLPVVVCSNAPATGNCVHGAGFAALNCGPNPPPYPFIAVTAGGVEYGSVLSCDAAACCTL